MVFGTGMVPTLTSYPLISYPLISYPLISCPLITLASCSESDTIMMFARECSATYLNYENKRCGSGSL
jgi:hypothetical protein